MHVSWNMTPLHFLMPLDSGHRAQDSQSGSLCRSCRSCGVVQGWLVLLFGLPKNHSGRGDGAIDVSKDRRRRPLLVLRLWRRMQGRSCDVARCMKPLNKTSCRFVRLGVFGWLQERPLLPFDLLVRKLLRNVRVNGGMISLAIFCPLIKGRHQRSSSK
jgi:hypothetical protein